MHAAGCFQSLTGGCVLRERQDALHGEDGRRAGPRVHEMGEAGHLVCGLWARGGPAREVRMWDRTVMGLCVL